MARVRASAPVVAAVAVALCVGPFGAARTAHALAKLESDDASLELVGALRLTGAFMHQLDPALPLGGDDALTGGELRLLATGTLPGDLTYEVNGFADVARGATALLGSSFATAGGLESAYRLTYLTYDYWHAGAVAGRLGLDRARVTFKRGMLDLTAGRFPVNHSVTRVFAPNDFFAPFSASAINKVYKPGVDALQVGLETGELSAVEITGVLGHPTGSTTNSAPTWGASALLARASTVLWDTELALLGGKIAGRWIVGASFQGEAAGLGLRGEGHVGFPDARGDFTIDDLDGDGSPRDDIFVRLAAGFDKTWTWHNATVAFEYAFSSDGAPWPAAYLGRAAHLTNDEQPFLGRHYAGVMAGGELIPILKVGLLGLVNVADGSGLASLSLDYSIADEATFVGGLMLPWGRKSVSADSPGALPHLRSEFGMYPLVLFLEMRCYF